MPIKRIPELQFLSRDHHHGLLLCWKIQVGLKNKIAPARIKAYSNWFYLQNLLPHFEVEEKYVFTILGEKHELVKRALAEHRKLKQLFEKENDLAKNLGLIEEKLEAHIRFEERILFNEIQRTATSQELEAILKIHDEKAAIGRSDWEDEFWK